MDRREGREVKGRKGGKEEEGAKIGSQEEIEREDLSPSLLEQ